MRKALVDSVRVLVAVATAMTISLAVLVGISAETAPSPPTQRAEIPPHESLPGGKGPDPTTRSPSQDPPSRNASQVIPAREAHERVVVTPADLEDSDIGVIRSSDRKRTDLDAAAAAAAAIQLAVEAGQPQR